MSCLQLINSTIHRVLPGGTSLLGRGDHTILEQDEQDTLFGWFLKYAEVEKQFAPGKLTVCGTCSNLPLTKPPLFLSKTPSCLQHQSLNFSPPKTRQSQINMHARGIFLDSATWNIRYTLMCLNTWSLDGSPAWESCKGDEAFQEEVCHWWVGFDVL